MGPPPPSDSRAQQSVRLCRLLAETSSHGAPAAEDEPGERPDGEPEVRVEAVQDELDVALSAFDGLLPKGAAEADTSPDGAIPDADTSPGAHAREAVTSPGIEEEPPEPAPHEKPSSEDLALDFELDATGLGPESDGHADDILAADGAPPDLGEMLLDQDGEPEGGSSASGELEPVESNPAEEELRRRVRDLLDDARTAASEGRREKALTVLGRLFILDENNVEGRALQQSLQESKTEAEGEMDRRVADGVRLLQEGNRDGARDLFLSVLDEVPDHAEARAQLDRLEGVETGDGDPGELQLGEFAPDTFDQVADHGAVDLGETERGEEASELPLAGGAAAGVDRDAFGSLIGVEGHAAEEPAEAVEPVGAELPEEPTSRSSSRLLLVVALVVAVAAGGGFTAWKMGMLGFLPGAETGAEPQPPVRSPRRRRTCGPPKICSGRPIA